MSFAPDSTTYDYIAVGVDYATPGSGSSTAGANYTENLGHSDFLQASEYSTNGSSPTTFPMSDSVEPTSWIDAGVVYTSDPQLIVTTNWTGYEAYVLASGAHKEVYETSAAWLVPTASIPPGQTCRNDAPSPPYWGCDFSVWTGMSNSAGGVGPLDLIQAGSDSDISVNDSNLNGAPTYFLWYELLPSPYVTCLRANAGDYVEVQITNDALVGGSLSDWALSVYDSTTGRGCSGLGDISYKLDGENSPSDVPYFAQYIGEDAGLDSISSFNPTTIIGLYYYAPAGLVVLSQSSPYHYNDYSMRSRCGGQTWTSVTNAYSGVISALGEFTESFISANCVASH